MEKLVRGAKNSLATLFFIFQVEIDYASHSSHALKCGDFWLNPFKDIYARFSNLEIE